MRNLEFWPDYGGVLLHEGGAALAMDGLGLPTDLVDRARGWVARYDDTRLDPDSRDEAWIAEGRRLYDDLRSALCGQSIELVDWEGYWATPEAR